MVASENFCDQKPVQKAKADSLVEKLTFVQKKRIVDTGGWIKRKFETYFEHGQERSKHDSSTVETYLEQGREAP